ncbi:MAG: hypothetical protein QNK90_00030 [Opitutaceae bacterium]|tara:strand:- start:1245 stop:1604 length:360 start_codon:yes stop_codon:yes gene_type:complete
MSQFLHTKPHGHEGLAIFLGNLFEGMPEDRLLIYAELAAAYRTEAALERALRHWPLVRIPYPTQQDTSVDKHFETTVKKAGKNDHLSPISTSEPMRKSSKYLCSPATSSAIELTFQKRS